MDNSFISGLLNIPVWHLLAPFYVDCILNGSVGKCNVNELQRTSHYLTHYNFVIRLMGLSPVYAWTSLAVCQHVVLM